MVAGMLNPLLLTLVLLRGADATTTLLAGHEANPLLTQNPRVAVSLLVPITVVQIQVLRHAKPSHYTWDAATQTYRSHATKKTKALAVASVVAEALVVTANVHTLRRSR